jgi:hypothetical protein
MWKALWQKWTVDKPAALGDLLWDVFVVQFAAYLDRLTLRRIIALIPVVVLILAYDHKIPIPPEFVLVGDFLAYIDIFTVVFLLGVLGRITAVMFTLRQATARAAGLVNGLMAAVRRLDVRHRREGGVRGRKRLTGRAKDDDGEPAGIRGFAWA